MAEHSIYCQVQRLGPCTCGATPKLAVWFGPMPESNGKTNWTAILHRAGAEGFDRFTDGLTLARSEYHDRVRYEADRARHLIGELAEAPDIIDYDPDLRAPKAGVGGPIEAQPVAWMTDEPEPRTCAAHQKASMPRQIAESYCIPLVRAAGVLGTLNDQPGQEGQQK